MSSRRVMASWLKPAFNPKMLAPSLWLDASDRHTMFNSDGITLTPDGQRCVVFRDKSGNGWYFSRGDANGPVVTPNHQNGRTALKFEGTTDFNSAFLASYTDYTMFVVVKANSLPGPGGVHYILLNGDGGNGFGASYRTDPTTPNFTMLHGGVAWNQLGAAVLTP
jgi:hypothetical protein